MKIIKKTYWYVLDKYKSYTRKPLEVWHPPVDLNINKEKPLTRKVDYAKNTERELEDLLKMAKNWTDYYIRHIDRLNQDYNITLMKDLMEEIVTYMIPYVMEISKFPENQLSKGKVMNFAGVLTDITSELEKKVEESKIKDLVKIEGD